MMKENIHTKFPLIFYRISILYYFTILQLTQCRATLTKWLMYFFDGKKYLKRNL